MDSPSLKRLKSKAKVKKISTVFEKKVLPISQDVKPVNWQLNDSLLANTSLVPTTPKPKSKKLELFSPNFNDAQFLSPGEFNKTFNSSPKTKNSKLRLSNLFSPIVKKEHKEKFNVSFSIKIFTIEAVEIVNLLAGNNLSLDDRAIFK